MQLKKEMTSFKRAKKNYKKMDVNKKMKNLIFVQILLTKIGGNVKLNF